METALSNPHAGAGGASKGAPVASASLAPHQLQMFGHSRAGQARGDCCAQAPAVVHDNVRDWMASRHAGFMGADAPNLLINWRGLNCAPSFSHSHRLPVLPRSSRKRVCLLPPGQTRAYSVRSAGCTLPRAQSLAHKQVIQAVAYGPHLSNLSSSVAFAGFQPSEAPNGRAHNSRADLQKSEGELPDVRC